MKPLEHPNQHHVNAAMGWLELGNVAEAREELANISEEQRDHPDVLCVRWFLHVQEKEWEKALGVSRRMILNRPNSPESWINQSYALHELQRTEEAFRELRQVADRFRRVGTIPYNLACYTCRMGRLDEARSWLKQAEKILGKDQVIAVALDDPDLKELRDELNGR